MKQRLIFKILLQVYRSRNNSASGYICSELLHARPPTGSLRSNTEDLHLAVPRTRTAWGDCSFAETGPQLWNALPFHVRQSDSLATFKKALKTPFTPALQRDCYVNFKVAYFSYHSLVLGVLLREVLLVELL